MPDNFFYRGLPHWHKPGASFFVTFRLAGTVPQSKLVEWKDLRDHWLKNRPDDVPEDEHQINIHKRVFKLLDDHLDSDFTIDWLRNPEIAKAVRESLLHGNGETVHMQSWCIMPNHVHALVRPLGEGTDRLTALSQWMESRKGFTARAANRILGRTGPFWEETYDHWVRDEFEKERILNYIRMNPVKAGLAREPWEWIWSSCHDRFKLDGDTTGWLPMDFQPG